MDVTVIRDGKDPTKPDALTRAAEKWGGARVEYRDKGDQITRRNVSAFRCPVCKRWVAYGRGRVHLGEHLLGKS